MKSTTLRLVLFGFAASVGSLLLSACGTDSEGTIQVYTGRHYDLEAAFEAFESEFGIDIEFLEGSDAELALEGLEGLSLIHISEPTRRS